MQRIGGLHTVPLSVSPNPLALADSGGQGVYPIEPWKLEVNLGVGNLETD